LLTVDVILPFHRIDKFLTNAVRSVLASKGVKVSLIAIDDRIERSLPIDFEVSTTTNGIGYEKAINVAKKYLKSEYTALMNSDDLMHPQRFITQIESLKKNQREISVTRLKKINTAGIPQFMLGGNPQVEKYLPGLNLVSSHFSNASWLARTDFWCTKVHFEEQGMGSDWATGLKIFQENTPAVVSKKLYSYRQHSQQITQSSSSIQSSLQDSWRNLNFELGFPKLDTELGLKLVFPQLRLSERNFAEGEIYELDQWINSFRYRFPGLDAVLAPRVTNLCIELDIFNFIKNQKWIHNHFIKISSKYSLNKLSDFAFRN
jgi:glycosyltransferase involved in cell wall biosynthesis